MRTTSDFDEWSHPLLMLGTAHAVSGDVASDEGEDRVRALREVVRKLDPSAVTEPAPRRIGFF